MFKTVTLMMQIKGIPKFRYIIFDQYRGRERGMIDRWLSI